MNILQIDKEVIYAFNNGYTLCSVRNFMSMYIKQLTAIKHYIYVNSTSHRDIFANYLERHGMFCISYIPHVDREPYEGEVFSTYFDEQLIVLSYMKKGINAYVIKNNTLIPYIGKVNKRVLYRLESFLLLNNL